MLEAPKRPKNRKEIVASFSSCGSWVEVDQIQGMAFVAIPDFYPAALIVIATNENLCEENLQENAALNSTRKNDNC